MSQNLDIELKPVIPKEYPTFIKNLQEAFSPAIIENLAQMNIFHLKTIYYPHLLLKMQKFSTLFIIINVPAVLFS